MRACLDMTGPRLRGPVGVLVLLAVALVAPAARAVTVSPLPGTPDASPSTQISFLGIPASEIHQLSVVGSHSGTHRGTLRAYASAPGASFVPAHGFAEGETVDVGALVGPSGHAQRIGESFTVAQLVHYRFAPASTATPRAKPGTVQSFVSEPGLHPPQVAILASAPGASDQDVFVAANGSYPQRGPMIFDRAGRLVWFKPLPPGKAAMDLQVERYGGQPVLVWWQGYIGLSVGFGTDELYSSSYRPLAAVTGGNGYRADLHDIQLTPGGAAFITAFSPVEANLSPVGGAYRAALLDAIVQEVDVRTGLVMFEWHAYGHVALGDSYWSRPASPATPWDFFHVNSISFDPWGDGNFLISSRNTWAGYEIDHDTGQVLWRIGGRRSTFKLDPGTGMAWQHDIRWQPDHTLTAFDNGDAPREHQQTRIVHERIDWHARTVRLLSQAGHTPPWLANSQGNAQRLPDGSSFVGWGALPYVSEYSPADKLTFEARLAAPGASYRAFTFAWTGTPAAPPALALRAASAGAVSAYASWNGATGVSSWRLLAGPSSTQLAPVTTVPSSGFETAIPAQAGQPCWAAAALDDAGATLATSAVDCHPCPDEPQPGCASAASTRPRVSSRPSSATLSKMPGDTAVPASATRSGW